MIVGGGPAGLVTALLLARHGVASTLVERRPRVSALPKARGMHARAMEIFRSLDLEQEFVARALPLEPVARIQPTLADPVLRAMPTGGPALTPVSPCEGASVAQDVVEAVLRERVDANPLIEAAWGSRCSSIATDSGGATLGLDTDEDPRTVRARYVVAADGARSTVRAMLGIPMDGEPDFPRQRLIAFRADLRRWVGERPGAIYLLTAAGSVLLWTHPDDRWVLNLAASGTPAVPAVRSVLGTPDLEPEILADGVFSPGTTCAARLRQGPVFLVGDAAHRVTPAGATGMNMAIQDAHNLAWKLAAVLHGSAGPSLLDSYPAEREPIGRRNAAESRAAWAAGVEAIGAGPAAGRAPARGVREIDMGHAYRSAAVLDDERPDPPCPAGVDYLPTAAPGRRAPHLWVRPGVSTIDLFGDGFVLLVTGEGGCWRAAHPTEGLRVAVISEPGFAQLYGIDPDGAVLVRPDGHVAARWRSAPSGAARDLVRDALAVVLGTGAGSGLAAAQRPWQNSTPRAVFYASSD